MKTNVDLMIDIFRIVFVFEIITFFSQELELKEGSLNYNNWIETPIPMYLKITLFNWTNPEDIRNPNIKPNFVECGPYVFLEKHRRTDIEWSSVNDTVAYNQIRTWHFVPEMSKGHLNDTITNINVMASVSVFLHLPNKGILTLSY